VTVGVVMHPDLDRGGRFASICVRRGEGQKRKTSNMVKGTSPKCNGLTGRSPITA